MKIWIIGGLTLAAGIAACSNQVSITPEKSSGTLGAGGAGSSGTSSTGNGSSSGTQGAGGAGPSGTSSTGNGSGASSSTGAGGSGPGFTKVVTADTDIGQYVSVTTNSADPVNLVATNLIEGPFFLTDALFYAGSPPNIVQGSDCTVPESKHIPAFRPAASVGEIHGMRIPIMAGQSLCGFAATYSQTTVFGFKPY